MTPRSLARLRPAVVGLVAAAAVAALGTPAVAASSTRPARHAATHRQRSGAHRPTAHRPAAHRPAARRLTPQQALASRVRADLAGVGRASFRFDVAGFGSLTSAAAAASPPASTQKLLTAQAALDRLGPDHRFRTTVLATVPPTAGLVDGDLVVVAGGDPLLSSSQLQDLAVQARSAGVRQVHGDVVVDDSAFPARSSAPGWGRRFVPDEVGPVTAFAVDENGDRRDAAYLADPSLANTERLADALAEAGVQVDGHVRRGSRPVDGAPGTTTLGTAFSPPLSAVVATMLTASDNFVAEVLLDDLGVAAGTPTAAGGVAVLDDECRALGCLTGRTVDGSGLSRNDAQSPDALVGLLRSSAASPVGPVLAAGLPVSCRTGTLRHRLCGAGVAGVVHAKTGTLDHVRTLAGYATTRSGRPVVFAVMISAAPRMGPALRALDRAVADVVLRG